MSACCAGRGYGCLNRLSGHFKGGSMLLIGSRQEQAVALLVAEGIEKTSWTARMLHGMA